MYYIITAIDATMNFPSDEPWAVLQLTPLDKGQRGKDSIRLPVSVITWQVGDLVKVLPEVLAMKAA